MSRGFGCVKISIYRGNPEEGTIPKFFFFSCPHSFARRRLYFSEVLFLLFCLFPCFIPSILQSSFAAVRERRGRVFSGFC